MRNQFTNRNFKKWAYCEMVYDMTPRAFRYKRLLPIMFLYFLPLIGGAVIASSSMPIGLIAVSIMSLLVISIFGLIYFVDEKSNLDDKFRRLNNQSANANIKESLQIARSSDTNLNVKNIFSANLSELKKRKNIIKNRKKSFYQLILVLLAYVLATPKILFNEVILADNVLIFIEVFKYLVILWGVKVIYFMILDNEIALLNEIQQIIKRIRKK